MKNRFDNFKVCNDLKTAGSRVGSSVDVGGFVSKSLVQSGKGQGGLARGMVLFVFGGGGVLVVKVYDTR